MLKSLLIHIKSCPARSFWGHFIKFLMRCFCGMFLFSSSVFAWNTIVDCVSCEHLSAEIKNIIELEHTTKSLLDESELYIGSLAQDDARRIKVSSNIMILTAKLEIFQNRNVTKSQDIKKMKCDLCLPK